MNKNFWFGVLLTASIIFTIWCFDYADVVRGYNSTGGEVFMIALPLWIVWNKLQALGQKIQRLKKQNKELQKHLL